MRESAKENRNLEGTKSAIKQSCGNENITRRNTKKYKTITEEQWATSYFFNYNEIR